MTIQLILYLENRKYINFHFKDPGTLTKLIILSHKENPNKSPKVEIQIYSFIKNIIRQRRVPTSLKCLVLLMVQCGYSN